MISLTEKQPTLASSLDAHFGTTDAGHYFERILYPDVLIISLNWRLQQSGALTEDIELLRKEHDEQYHVALETLEITGDLASFTCNVSYDKYVFPRNFEQL